MKNAEKTSQESVKILRENLFNRVFRKRKLREQRAKYDRICNMLQQAEEFDKALQKCNSLVKMLAIHKNMWDSGFKNANIGPCKDGAFRTKDILTMTPDEVFLGNIYGLWTYPIPEWENQRNALYGVNAYGINPGTTVYNLILGQYRHLLRSNLEAIILPEKEWLETFKSTKQ